eukprot:GHVT01002388.1.p2 GENE.GHVT01002388.1~~GHVT01002388.1.p2  ORF type:complete len:104 (-),score=14.59 GHVT01002388.1:543-854(-)
MLSEFSSWGCWLTARFFVRWRRSLEYTTPSNRRVATAAVKTGPSISAAKYFDCLFFSNDFLTFSTRGEAAKGFGLLAAVFMAAWVSRLFGSVETPNFKVFLNL